MSCLPGAGAGRKPLFIELFAGLHGWGEGAVKEGYFVVGFDIVDMCKEIGVERPKGCNLVLQDVTTLHGSQLKDAAVIVASPPCTEYSYMAMPWKRAKQIALGLRGQGEFPLGYKGSRSIEKLTLLFNECFRLQREASEAAGRHIPLIVENVKGTQPWVGRAPWNFGSFYLWGDVPALMPIVAKRRMKYNADCSWFNVAHNMESGVGRNPVHEGAKAHGSWFGNYAEMKAAGRGGGQRYTSSNSVARARASAEIAKIPFPLSSHIARCFLPVPAGMEEGT